MKKISTVFVVNRELGVAMNEVRPENQWVVDGEGIATVKFDGTSCAVFGGVLYKRFDQKLKKQFEVMRKRKGDKFVVQEHMFRDLPDGAIPCVATYDPVTFHFPHWVPVDVNAPENCHHVEGLKNFVGELKDGVTYELVGPAIGKNFYGLTSHELWEHGSVTVDVKDRSYDGLKKFLIEMNEEGLVFHHSDGRMAKLRRKDFAKPVDGQDDRGWEWKNATPDEFI